MALSTRQKEKISLEVIKTLVSRFESFPEDASKNRNAPFHEAFLEAFSDRLKDKVPDTSFFISLSSWLHGLNTTLGQSFFERIAHHLSDGEKREYTSKKLGNLQITSSQKEKISEIITNLSNSKSLPDVVQENKIIFQDDESSLVNAINFSVDVFIEDRDSIIGIELKSVKPNAGEMRGEKQKILEGKAALRKLFPDKKILFLIGFPFDPTVDFKVESSSSYDKSRFLKNMVDGGKYLSMDETLLAGELWDFLSGQKNTMQEILEIINTISTTSFLYKYQLLSDTSKRQTPEFKEQLRQWNLFSELGLLEEDDTIKKKIKNSIILKRIYNKTIFDNDGRYNEARYSDLNKILLDDI